MKKETPASNKIIVKKFGGATLATPEKIKSVAEHLKISAESGENLAIVVSAMGNTTNQLIDLAHQVSKFPKPREMDMLLSTGERISMALLSLALNEISQPAVSYTGSQAGILTTDSHVQALIQDIKGDRIKKAMDEGKVVVLAGFQGVSPVTKEITTLGRGGSDTTAVALAGYLKAERCEILKDVPAVLSADPRVVANAKPLHQINYSQLLDMTFWGAKVLHYRAVELAQLLNVTLFVGPAHDSLADDSTLRKALGTTITRRGPKLPNLLSQGEIPMNQPMADLAKSRYESHQVLSVNSHETVYKINLDSTSLKSLQQDLKSRFEFEIPQIIFMDNHSEKPNVYMTGPNEILKDLENYLTVKKINFEKMSSVTLTITSSTFSDIIIEALDVLGKSNIKPTQVINSALSTSFLLPATDRTKAIQTLHTHFIES